jgi:peptide/nickel transport system permease protein
MRRVAGVLLILILAAVLGTRWLAPVSYETQSREEPSARPSRPHPLGTDALGRDRFSRLLYGGRVSLVMAPVAALGAVVLSLALALAAGVWGGWPERILSMASDLLLSIPWLFLLLAARAALPLNVPPETAAALTFALLGLLGWAGPARVLLAAVKRHLNSGFILHARAMGCRPWRLALAHLTPHLWPLVLAQFWITTPAFLLSEANLGLLGLGVAEPVPSWGGLLRELENPQSVAEAPWIVAPLLALLAVTVCLQVAGQADETGV